MPAKTPRLAFVTRYGSANGADLMLHSLVAYLKSQTDWDLEVWVTGQGTLFQGAPYPSYRRRAEPSLAEKIVHRLRRDPLSPFERYWQQHLDRYQPDLLVLNGPALRDFDFFLNQPSRPYIYWSHELPQAWSQFPGAQRWAKLLSGAQQLWGCSQQVVQMLSQSSGRPAKLLPEAVDPTRWSQPLPSPAETKARLGLAPETPLVVMAGLQDWRKGFHLVPELVQALAVEGIHFLWVGQAADNALHQWVSQSLVSLPNYHCREATPQDMGAWLAAADVFALTSLEDPFPLVMLEAAWLGKPLVGFADSGGLAEFWQPGMGILVPGFRAADFGQAIIHVLKDPSLYSPEHIHQRAQAYHWDEVGKQALLSLKQALEKLNFTFTFH